MLIAIRTPAVSGAYVALGDSYASGIGVERYGDESGACLRSPLSYAHQLDRAVSLGACGGATTGDVLRGL